MSLELIHASVARGLRGGSGFSTVAMTRGIPHALVAALEELSAYDPDPIRAIGADPVERAHRIVTLPSGTYTVLSRIEPCGVDASGRPNRIAHHLVIDGVERGPGGPAATIAAFTGWERAPGAAEERPAGPKLPDVDARPRVATAWRACGLDAGWAGVVAQHLVDRPQVSCYLVFAEELDVLPLLEDVFALLPPDRRWMATFSTRYRRYPPHVRCQIRCVREGAPGVAALLGEPGVAAYRVAQPPADEFSGVDAGRHGRICEATRSLTGSSKVEPLLGKSAGRPDLSERGAVATRAPHRPQPSEPTPGAAHAAWQEAHRHEPATRAPSAGGWLAPDLVLFVVAGIGMLASFVMILLLLLSP